jgi:hypothetical protein
MDPEAARKRKARIVVLQEEIDSIHFANKLYWAKEEHSHTAIAEYERRQDRLEEIRHELFELGAN